MNKLIFIILSAIFINTAFAETATSTTATASVATTTTTNGASETPDVTEPTIFIPSAFVTQGIDLFMDSEHKNDAARTYIKVMHPEDGTISIAGLHSVCAAGGIDMSTQDGIYVCETFVEHMLQQTRQCQENNEPECTETFNEKDLDSFCPPTGNSLRSITAESRTGDICKSTNIYAGTVFRHKNRKTCGCYAIACNPGFEFVRGQCREKIADENGFCLRTAHPKNAQNQYMELCKNFCAEQSKSKGCKFSNAVIQHSQNQCVCNADVAEVDAAVESMHNEAQRRRIAEEQRLDNLPYYQVCGDDEGRGTCVDDFFNWTQTGVNQAIGFAQEYVRRQGRSEIVCNKKYRTYMNDDYIACTSTDGKEFWEFQFHDLTESIDEDRRISEKQAMCKLVGVKFNCINISQSQCNELTKLAPKFGHGAQWKSGNCIWTDLQNRTMENDAFEKSLAKIDGIDNRAFFNIQVVAARGNFDLERDVKTYIRQKLPRVINITCDPGYKTITAADNWFFEIIGDSDDIWRCYADGRPVDFVFNDLSELWNHRRDAGEAGAKCTISNGKFDGHYCRGLTKSECMDLEKKLAQELKSTGWMGDGDLVDWDDAAGACELNAAQFANNVDKVGKYTAIAGLTIGGVFTGGSTTVVAVSLMAVELVGMAGEIYVDYKKKVLPNEWANDFLAASRTCRESACAESTLRESMAKINSAADMLNRDTLAQVDSELARLAELIPMERFQDIYENAGRPGCWETWECQSYIFTGMQMVTLVTGIGSGLVKLTKTISGKMSAVSATARAMDAAADAGRAADAAGDAARAADAMNDARRAADAAADGARAADAAADGARAADGAADGARAADAAADGARAANNATDGARAADAAADGARAANSARVYNNADDVINAFNSSDDVVQFARADVPASDIRRIMAAARRAGYQCVDCGGDVLKFAKSSDSATDAAHAANAATDASRAADGAADNARAANNASDGARAADNANDAARAANNANDAANWAHRSDDEILDALRNSGNNDANKILDQLSAERATQIRNLQSAQRKLGGQLSDISRGRPQVAKYTSLTDSEQMALFKYAEENGISIKMYNQPNGAGGSLGEHIVMVKQTPDMMDNGTTLLRYRSRRLPRVNVNEPLTYIHGKPVYLETIPGSGGEVFGMVSGRPVVVVNVNGRRIPMYASSGSAGKLEVPTGKWEFIAGIDPQSGWFNKGYLEDILAHYHSPELRQIANALDSKIGDIRNVEDVVASASRAHNGGVGIVGSVDDLYDLNNAAGLDFINSGMKRTPGRSSSSAVVENIHDITNWLRNL